ncbi:hypothetical protein, partial [Clostridioides difficile]|uniref:hypothetical protein n=1 Tax=Clostridioides difficile TaxID=1496 RepID=UPI000BC71B80
MYAVALKKKKKRERRGARRTTRSRKIIETERVDAREDDASEISLYTGGQQEDETHVYESSYDDAT